LKTGKVVVMPSGYDEMTERAHINYTGGTDEQRRLRDLLRSAMEAEGFVVYEPEWWHYDYKDWKEYPILNIAFLEIRKQK
jgi:D-alanyl-D-alanine dipeptidase